MRDKIKGVAAAMAAVAVLAIGGAAIAGAANSDNSSSQPAQSAEDESGNEAPDQPISSGSDLDKASAAALQHTRGGQVTDTEVGDEESYYEVEVTLDDGSQVDVQLDRGFQVVGDEADEE
ncbi:MAG TPA: hypothetical protein VE401_01815 [Solirubrobacterales bacterium]|jgi:uncharacterized membrane protein YkoI|nr:hypothetical protein [Solirubrobacterales bacterium]